MSTYQFTAYSFLHILSVKLAANVQGFMLLGYYYSSARCRC